MIRSLKHKGYVLKSWIPHLLSYPTGEIRESPDYDEYWSTKRGVGQSKIGKEQKERADVIIRSLKDFGIKADSVVDVGCGDGSITRYIASRYPFSKITGVDGSDVALALSKESGLETVKADVSKRAERERIPPSDLVLLLEVLEHVSDSEALLRAAHKRARCALFFSFPNSGFFVWRLRLLFGKFPAQWKVHPAEHLRYWTLADLIWWLRALGLSPRRIDFWGGVPLLNRIMPSLFAEGFVVTLLK